jgi:hypothetical protein
MQSSYFIHNKSLSRNALDGLRIYKNPGPNKVTIAVMMMTAKQETIIVTGPSPRKIGAAVATLLLASPGRRSSPPISAIVPT